MHRKLSDPSCLQFLVIGRSGANGPIATPLCPMARSSDPATATMLPRLMPAMAIQMKRLLAQSLPIQVAYSKLNSFLLARLPRNFKFPLSTSFLQVLLVPGQSGGNGPSATPPGSMA